MLQVSSAGSAARLRERIGGCVATVRVMLASLLDGSGPGRPSKRIERAGVPELAPALASFRGDLLRV